MFVNSKCLNPLSPSKIGLKNALEGRDTREDRVGDGVVSMGGGSLSGYRGSGE